MSATITTSVSESVTGEKPIAGYMNNFCDTSCGNHKTPITGRTLAMMSVKNMREIVREIMATQKNLPMRSKVLVSASTMSCDNNFKIAIGHVGLNNRKGGRVATINLIIEMLTEYYNCRSRFTIWSGGDNIDLYSVTEALKLMREKISDSLTFDEVEIADCVIRRS